MSAQWSLRMVDSGDVSGLCGITNVNFRFVSCDPGLASSCAWLNDEALSMLGRISLSLYPLPKRMTLRFCVRILNSSSLVMSLLYLSI